MSAVIPVGQFATITHLSVKTLRHYHDVGLLTPARVDPDTGYRYYSLDQLPLAQLIRRLRALKMPVREVRSVVMAQDPAERNDLISSHMERLETELQATRAAVSSLRTLLDTARTRTPVTRRHAAAFTAIGIVDTIDAADILPWWDGALRELRDHVRAHGVRQTGPAGGIFNEALYQQERAEAALYLPVAAGTRIGGRIHHLQIPAAELATTSHYGPIADIDLAYADLGSYLAEHHLRVDKQIREHYLCDRSDTPDATRWHTEIAWPILSD